MKKTIFVISFVVLSGFLFGFTAPDAKAATVAELQAQIQQLMKQIAALQLQLSQLQPVTATWCHTFNVNLKIGDSGTEVKALRTALTKEGFSGLEAMGGAYEFDERVASAVVGFQEKYASEVLAPWGLTHGTGYVGPTTRAKLNQLYGCDAVRPYIKVLSPNGGETWYVGKTYEIKWQSSNIDKVSINLVHYGYYGGVLEEIEIATNISASLGRYSWIIPATLSGKPVTAFKVRIVSEKVTEDQSDNYFTIAPAEFEKSITVVSPNGGEKWVIGNTYTIKWSTTWDSSKTVQIGLIDTRYDSEAGPRGEATIAWSTSNTGSYTWAIPKALGTMDLTVTDLPVYKVKIYVDGGGEGKFDDSDAPFSIVSTETTCTDSDGGRDYFVKGKISGLYKGYINNFYDYCENSNVVHEFFCEGSEIKEALYTCSYSCRDGACQAGITVVSPNGGEKWEAGKTYDISWASEGTNYSTVHVNIYLWRNGEFVKTIALGVSPSTLGGSPSVGKYSWTIPSDLTVSDKYQVRVYASGIAKSDMSDGYFSIVSGTDGTCTDSDGGNNHYVKGTCLGRPNIYTDEVQSLADRCIAPRADYNYDLIEFSCGYVRDVLICVPHAYKCPYGCQDGACVSGSQSSVTITSSPQADTGGNVTIKQGDTIVIKGIPENLSGEMGVDYSRAFFFDSIFNGACSQTDWVMTCTAKQTGTSKFYIELYKDGQTYRSNVIQVTVIPYTPSSCTDSDGGNNIYVKGTVKNPATGQGGTDCCAIKTAADPRPSCTKFVTGKDEGNSVWEYICTDNGGVMGYLYSCPSGYTCSEGACVKEGVSSVTVLSPNGGEKWEINKTYTITWKHNLTGNFEAWIDLLKGGTYYGPIVEKDTPLSSAQNLTSYSWQVGQMKGGTGEGGDYQVRVTYRDLNTGATLEDNSDNYFSIVSGVTTCTDSDGGLDYFIKGKISGLYKGYINNFYDYCESSNVVHEFFCEGSEIKETLYTCSYGCQDGACQPGITVISPDGGEKWAIGETHDINWASEGTNYSSVLVNIYLWKGGQFIKTIALGVSPSTLGGSPSVGKYSWKIPSDLVASDRYQIRLYASGIAKSDMSDGYFSIAGTGTPVGLEHMSNQLASLSEAISRLTKQIKDLMGM